MPQSQVISYTDPTLDVWARFMRTRNLLYKVFSRDLQDLGIKPEQLGILNILKKSNVPVTPAMISRIYRREPHTVSVNLRRLQSIGMINLVKDLGRRNMIRVELTEAGAQTWQQAVTRTSSIRKVFEGLSSSEIEQLDSMINRLADNASTVLITKP
jgi:DNA-binding MarR family transcriptional regulator